MSNQFLSSEEYDERAHQLYNEGNFDEALETLREGLALYPHAVELHVGVGYARAAREEYAWARKAFEEALALDPEHEDALAGLGETLIKFGRIDDAIRCFRQTLELGYQDDVELMLQIGRAAFREGLIEIAKEFFDIAVAQVPESAEAVALAGYAAHRLSDDDGALKALRKALQLDSDHVEARIYLANILFDRGEYEASLYHLERTNPEDHWDELGIWRLIEMKKTTYRLREDADELRVWQERLLELAGDGDEIDDLFAEAAQAVEDAEAASSRNQLELFGAMLGELAQQKVEPARHEVVLRDGRRFEGTWDEIVAMWREASGTSGGRTLSEFMANEARRGFSITGARIPSNDAEAFLRASANAGLLRIVT